MRPSRRRGVAGQFRSAQGRFSAEPPARRKNKPPGAISKAWGLCRSHGPVGPRPSLLTASRIPSVVSRSARLSRPDKGPGPGAAGPGPLSLGPASLPVTRECGRPRQGGVRNGARDSPAVRWRRVTRYYYPGSSTLSLRPLWHGPAAAPHGVPLEGPGAKGTREYSTAGSERADGSAAAAGGRGRTREYATRSGAEHGTRGRIRT
jgi:hypothetical protein